MRHVLILLMLLYTILQAGATSPPVSKTETCNKGMWKLTDDDQLPQGRAKLQFKIQNNNNNASFYTTILACDGLVVKGTGNKMIKINQRTTGYIQYDVQTSKNTLAVPMKRTTGYIQYDVQTNKNTLAVRDHTCTLELLERTMIKPGLNSSVASLKCQLAVKTVFSRVIPHCKYIEPDGEEIVDYITVFQAQGRAYVHLKRRFNDVVRVERYCNSNPIDIYNHEDEIYFPFDSPNGIERVYTVDFYPDCDSFNESTKKLFMEERIPHCYMIVFAECQEGYVAIRHFNMILNRDSMTCLPPSSFMDNLLQVLKLEFRVESGPVATLLCVLCGIALLYLCLIPLCISKCAKDLLWLSIKVQERQFRHRKKAQRMGIVSETWADTEYDLVIKSKKLSYSSNEEVERKHFDTKNDYKSKKLYYSSDEEVERKHFDTDNSSFPNNEYFDTLDMEYNYATKSKRLSYSSNEEVPGVEVQDLKYNINDEAGFDSEDPYLDEDDPINSKKLRGLDVEEDNLMACDGAIKRKSKKMSGNKDIWKSGVDFGEFDFEDKEYDNAIESKERHYNNEDGFDFDEIEDDMEYDESNKIGSAL